MAKELTEVELEIHEFNELSKSDKNPSLSLEQQGRLANLYIESFNNVYDKWVEVKEPFTFRIRKQIVDEILEGVHPDFTISMEDYAIIKRRANTALYWSILGDPNHSKKPFLEYAKTMFKMYVFNR